MAARDLLDGASVPFEGAADVALIGAIQRSAVLQAFPTRSAENTRLAIEHGKPAALELVDEEFSRWVRRQRHAITSYDMSSVYATLARLAILAMVARLQPVAPQDCLAAGMRCERHISHGLMGVGGSSHQR
jgi:hypothetical protein